METMRHGVNREEALASVGDDAGLLAELAALFLETLPGYLAQIRGAVAAREARTLESAAHALKGSVGNFGARAASEAAFRLEQIGRGGDWPQAAPALAALEAEMDYVVADLKTISTEAAV
jgi:two-component system, sensor histidine kinase and response regulator